MYEAMDLCIECKACKAECPSSVDMAKIKFEFLAQYYDANGVPLRTRLFANIGRLNRLGSRSIGSHRQLDAAKTASFAQGWNTSGHPRAAHPASFRPPALHALVCPPHSIIRITPNPKSEVVLFIDPFTNFNYPEIGQAAVEVLEAAGFGD